MKKIIFLGLLIAMSNFVSILAMQQQGMQGPIAYKEVKRGDVWGALRNNQTGDQAELYWGTLPNGQEAAAWILLSGPNKGAIRVFKAPNDTMSPEEIFNALKKSYLSSPHNAIEAEKPAAPMIP